MADTNPSNLGSLPGRLRHARLLGGVSARELDRLAGTTPGHVWLIESGERPSLQASTAVLLATALGLSTDWLLSGVGDPPTEDSVRVALDHARTAHPRSGTDG